MKVSDCFKFPPLSNTPDKLIPSMACSNFVIDGETKIGIEVEVECVKYPPELESYYCWQMVEDNSLRNYGREFVTLPIAAKHAEASLRWLFSVLPKEREFSPRTSIHVHMNIRDLSVEQVKSLIYLYMIFENGLFHFAGGDRYKNIHCVPLIGSTIPSQLLLSRKDLFTKHLMCNWQKYCAFNLLPTFDGTRGTVEFRHMVGTDDVDKLMTWINLILCLKLYVTKISQEDLLNEIKVLNTNSQYRHMAEKVFHNFSSNLTGGAEYGTFEAGMEEGVTQVKLLANSLQFYQKLSSRFKPRAKEKEGFFYEGSAPGTINVGQTLNTFVNQWAQAQPQPADPEENF